LRIAGERFHAEHRLCTGIGRSIVRALIDYLP